MGGIESKVEIIEDKKIEEENYYLILVFLF